MGDAILHYSAIPKSKVPGVTVPPMPQTHPISPPYQQSSPMKAPTPPNIQQPYFPGSDGIQKQQIFTNLPPHYQQQNPIAPVGPHTPAQNQGYPVSSNTFQRNTSSSSTSSQAWDPNSSGGSTGMLSSSQRIDLNASSSSVQSIPSAHSPQKWDTQGSTDSNKGYTPSYSSRMSPDQQRRGFAEFQLSGAPASVLPHQMAQSPSQATAPTQRQPFGQNLQQQGIVGGYQQQFIGSPQGGHMIPPNPSERARPSSGPITFQGQGQAEDQREGLWMGAQPQQQQQQQQQWTQKSNSGHLFQISPQPGYGNQGNLEDIKKCCIRCLFCVVMFCGQVLSQCSLHHRMTSMLKILRFHVDNL